MSDDLLKQQEIGQFLVNLFRRVRALEKEARNNREKEINSAAEAPQDGNSFFNPYVFFPTKVATIISDEIVGGAIVDPQEDDTDPWAEKTVNGNTLIVPITVPANVSIPAVGDFIMAHFTGVYQDGSGTNQPRYGLFGGGGGSIQEAVVKEVNNDYLICKPYRGGTEVTTAATLVVASPWTFRRSIFDGQTIGGITYTYEDPFFRTADDGEFNEDQQILPAYLEDFSVIAVGTLSAVVDVGPTTTNLVDINYDGRAWAAIPIDS